MTTNHLSYQEAFKFVTECLEIKDVEAKSTTNRLELLNEMIREFHRCIPFNNLFIMSTVPSERQVPREKDMIKSITSKSGGVCITLNGFFKMLLEALNYEVICVRAKIFVSKIEDPHATLIVSNVDKKDDFYNVDVGIGYPTFRAIPLHDGHLPREDQFAFHHVRFEKRDKVFIRTHKKTAGFGDMKDRADDMWEPFLEFDLIPREFAFFDKSMNVIFTDESISVLLNIAYASIYPPSKAITLRDLTLRVWNEDTGKITTTTFESCTEAVSAIATNFPMIDERVIREGLAYWQDHQNRKKLNESS